MTEKLLCNVAIPPLQGTYTYSIGNLRDGVLVGQEVTVPLGRRLAHGFITGITDELAPEIPREKVKALSGLVETEPVFNEDQLRFFEWVARYYGEPLSNVIEAAIPPRAKKKHRRLVQLKEEVVTKGAVAQKVVEALRKADGPVPVELLEEEIKGATDALARLEKKGVVEYLSEEVRLESLSSGEVPHWAKRAVTLNEFQERALEEILKAETFASFLLHGVTGSGKTEVYIEAIREVVAKGKGALVIVPEIALTPQLVDRFRGRLGERLAVLHSGLSQRVRWEGWRTLLEEGASVAIGARSGIFAPVPNLGLIIVDEEHDGSYKQQEGLRYNARDLALARGQLEGCPVVLGSATPSLESYYNAFQKRYTYLPLPSRHESGSSLSVRLIDMNKKKPWEMKSKNLSPELHDAIAETVQRGEQAFILYNRRGFSNYLQCDQCEFVMHCPHCSVTLTFHKTSGRALCHYCNFSSTPPESCPSCLDKGGEKVGAITYRGAGTEKIFDELVELFPEVKIERLDRDVASDEIKYRGILDRVRSEETQVLVGTQMIAKGHDLPGVTLVGVVDCDVGLHMPDFRAGERIFQLLTQASGRAGRAEKPGRVLLQTRVPNHPSLIRTVAQDFRGFAQGELTARQELGYPPFTRLLRIVASSEDMSIAEKTLSVLRARAEQFIRQSSLELKLLGPAPAPLARLKTLYRWHLLVKSKSAGSLLKLMRDLKNEKTSTKVRVIFDLDPQDLL